MTYRGQVKNGVVVLEGGPALPEGTQVRVEPMEVESADVTADTLADFLRRRGPGTRTPEEINRQVRDERDAWGE